MIRYADSFRSYVNEKASIAWVYVLCVARALVLLYRYYRLDVAIIKFTIMVWTNMVPVSFIISLMINYFSKGCRSLDTLDVVVVVVVVVLIIRSAIIITIRPIPLYKIEEKKKRASLFISRFIENSIVSISICMRTLNLLCALIDINCIIQSSRQNEMTASMTHEWRKKQPMKHVKIEWDGKEYEQPRVKRGQKIRNGQELIHSIQ